jgi:hypothetical protein
MTHTPQRRKENEMSSILEPGNDPTAPAAEPLANRFTTDAHERMTRLRAMAAEFPDESDPKPLTLAEVRLARQTSAAALEKAAVFAEAAPAVGGAVTDVNVTELRDAIAFELAYTGVRDEARAMAHRVDRAILRRKLKAVKAARGLYRVAKGFITLDAGDPVRTHVADMKRTLTRPRRSRKNAPPAEPDTAAAKK